MKIKDIIVETQVNELDNGPNGTYSDNINYARHRQDPAKADYSAYGAQAKATRAAQSAAKADARREKSRTQRREDRLLDSMDEQDVMQAIRKSGMGVGDPDHFTSYKTSWIRVGGQTVAAVKCGVYTSIDPREHLGYAEGGDPMEEIIYYTVYRDPNRPSRLVAVQGSISEAVEEGVADDVFGPDDFSDEEEYYEEPVGRFRVMRQLNDPERNPEGDWSLVYSTSDADDANEVAAEQQQQWGKFGDKIKVVDAGKATTIKRAMY